jgi:hypothetical protein
MSTTASEITQLAKQDFMDRNKNLLALTKEGPNGVFRRVAAALALDSEASQDCLLYLDVIDQKGHAGQVARQDLQRELYRAICKAFLRCQHNFVIEFATKLTDEALTELEDIEITSGQRSPRPVEAPLQPPKSAQELVTEEVLLDWKRLPADKVKLKLNNRAYKAEFDRLMAADQLDSQITTLHDHSEEFRR